MPALGRGGSLRSLDSRGGCPHIRIFCDLTHYHYFAPS
jgi:hypothetical protein